MSCTSSVYDNISTNFRYNSSKTVKGVCDRELTVFCTDTDGHTHTYKDRQADCSNTNLAASVDQDQAAKNMQTDLDLHCLTW